MVGQEDRTQVSLHLGMLLPQWWWYWYCVNLMNALTFLKNKNLVVVEVVEVVVVVLERTGL